jgi:hypothetical protein
MKKTSNCLLAVTVWLPLLLWPLFDAAANAQENRSTGNSPTAEPPNSTGSESGDPSPAGIRLGPGSVSDWQFGVNISAKLNSSGIKAYFPIPRNWPEQDVEIIAETKSDNVGKLSIKEPTDWTKQVDFAVKKMAAGQQSQVVLKIRIKKRMILAPEDTSQYRMPKRVRGKLRTFLKPSPYIESQDKRIREIAKNLTDETLSAWEQVEKNYRWVRETVQYKFDPVIQTCLTALDKKEGDCEELSSLFIAICRCQGVPARAVWIPDHTYPEFYLEDAKGVGYWFPCQAAGTYAFGSMPETRPILQKGDSFKNPNAGLPGQPKKLRYIAPSLSARPGSELAIQFLRRPTMLEQGLKSTGDPDDDSK